VDNVNVISSILAHEVTLKASSSCRLQGPELSTDHPEYTQAGLIRQDRSIQAQGFGRVLYAVVAVTAKHNLRKLGNYDALNPKMSPKANESITN
jgi:hypothetical protein